MMWFRYILYAILSVIMDAVAVVVAPIAALFVKYEDGREYLKSPFHWLTTHDAPVDSFLFDEYWMSYPIFVTLQDYHGNSIVRYFARIMWIWRNPAYKFDHMLGYDQTGIAIKTFADASETWDSGKPSYGFKLAINDNFERAFLYERQIYYYKRMCLELQFGWKLYRNDPDKVCMLAFRISPFKRY